MKLNNRFAILHQLDTKIIELFLLVSPSVSDSWILFKCGTEGGNLLSTALQHVILHISLEGAVEVLKGIHFIQGEDLNTQDTTWLIFHWFSES